MSWFLSRERLGKRPVLERRCPIPHRSSVCFGKAHERHVLGVTASCQATPRMPRGSSLHSRQRCKDRSLPQRSLCSWRVLRAPRGSRCARLPWVCPAGGRAPRVTARGAHVWPLGSFSGSTHTACPLSPLYTEPWGSVGFTSN